MEQTVYLFVLSSFGLAGEIAVPGDIVEVTNSEARDLLDRGKARVATEEDRPADEADADAAADADAEHEGEAEPAAEAEAPARRARK